MSSQPLSVGVYQVRRLVDQPNINVMQAGWQSHSVVQGDLPPQQTPLPAIAWKVVKPRFPVNPARAKKMAP
jgi:hypothetical protein